jgi:TolA-binding protein
MPSLVDDAANGFALGEAEDVSSGQGALQAEAAPSKQTQFGPYTSDFRMGEEAYARGDCKTATSALLRVVNQPSAHPAEAAYATHHIGACEKRRGRCGKAIVWYEQLFAGYPNYKNRAVALREASICYRRLGQPKKAQAMLDQLNRIMPDMEQLD